MSTANSILVISDKDEDILKFRSKLVLLRDIDSIIGTTVDKAVEFCRKYIPDTVIAFVHDKNESLFEICKAIRLDSVLKNTPIIFIFDLFDEEFILSSFDAGISDYVVLPARESDILMRVIWCLQKSETARELEKKEMLLNDLGITDKTTGAYTSEFISKVFTNEINIAKKYKYPLVLMAVCVDIKHKNKINDSYLAGVVKKSIRNSDALGIPGEGKFYLILPKTRVKGACSVYDRIIKNLGTDLSVSAGICEYTIGMDYELISSFALDALNEAMSRGGNRVIVFEKPEKEDKKASKISKSWLNKVSTDKRDYESFKKSFSERINTVISPAFIKFQNEIKKQSSENVIAEQFVTDTKCFFSIKEAFEGAEALLKIIDPGFSRVIIDNYYTQSDNQTNKRLTVELNELTEENIVKILQNLYNEFKKISGSKK